MDKLNFDQINETNTEFFQNYENNQNSRRIALGIGSLVIIALLAGGAKLGIDNATDTMNENIGKSIHEQITGNNSQ